MFELKIVVYIMVMIAIGIAFWRMTASAEARAMTDGKVEAVALALPFVIFFMPHIWGLYLFCVLLVPAVARTKAQAVGLFLLAAAMIPQFFQPQAVAGVYIFIAGTVTFLLIGLMACMALPGRIGRPPLIVDLFVLALALAIAITAIRGGGVPIRPIVETLATIVLPYLLISRMLADGAAIRSALTLLVFAGVGLTSISAFEAVRHWPLYQEAYGHYGMPLPDLSSVLRVRGGLMRAPATFPESTTFGVFLAVVFVAAALNRSMFRTRFTYGAALAFLAIGIVATVSRGAILGTVAALAVGGWYRGYGKQTLSAVGGFAALTALLFVVLPQTSRLHQMFGFQGYGESGVADYRVLLWERGTALFWENPVIGLPVDTVIYRLSSLRAGGIVDFVNSYLYFAMTSGVIGAAIFAGVMIAPLVLLLSVRSRLTPEQTMLAATAAGTLAMLMLALFFTAFSERNPLWLLMTVAMAGVLVRETGSDPLSGGSSARAAKAKARATATAANKPDSVGIGTLPTLR